MTFGDDFSITFVFALSHDLWWDLKEALYFSIDFRRQPSSDLQAFVVPLGVLSFVTSSFVLFNVSSFATNF
jgi:hypothetical protein